ncbi:DNA-binding MurR/RpiR family transcriptional regulator [Rhizobium mesoamericanum]|uniref:MurR/RpiR family transcriptional regulator n=1 Tax=Rhizobium mesoamericanum TaxID=1079800 RepID=UPI00278615BE|nr:MurR/RpiR family transcriptional regulator [Rhizobium mesoamericanum]MDQ0561544.1 DNA-binding MurR/RpiR family transcriptional regulator [Rhizobium mesoamericanum]
MLSTSVEQPSISDLKQLIVQRRVTYPASLQQAMRLLLGNPGVISFGTLRSVAHACNVSETSITRLASHSGYSSFKEMQGAFRQHLVALAASHFPVVQQRGSLQ